MQVYEFSTCNPLYTLFSSLFDDYKAKRFNGVGEKIL